MYKTVMCVCVWSCFFFFFLNVRKLQGEINQLLAIDTFVTKINILNNQASYYCVCTVFAADGYLYPWRSLFYCGVSPPAQFL